MRVEELSIGNENVEKSCETCLFYVDAMPDVIICIRYKRIKEFANMKHNCKRWVENTPENAKRELKKIKEEQYD